MQTKRTLGERVRDQRGFTLHELLIVMAILGILVQIAMISMLEMRRSALDTSAISDARHLVQAAMSKFMDKADVNLVHASGEGREVGNTTIGGVARAAVFTLSPGVKARVIGSSDWAGDGNGYMEAWVYHPNGNEDVGTPSGRREFYCIIDEAAGISSFPDL
ncbi:MAG: type II secretion system protein [Desulfosarcinaceae bacterium]|jgi:prepilin-type N-terminal cleavage/methylation domain-containing protein